MNRRRNLNRSLYCDRKSALISFMSELVVVVASSGLARMVGREFVLLSGERFL